MIPYTTNYKPIDKIYYRIYIKELIYYDYVSELTKINHNITRNDDYCKKMKKIRKFILILIGIIKYNSFYYQFVFYYYSY